MTNAGIMARREPRKAPAQYISLSNRQRNPMFLDSFFSRDGTDIRISAEQGNRFAKRVAGDFNPIHDADNKRFCVPGDLLFALVLCGQGLNPRMGFRFTGLLGADTPLRFPEPGTGDLTLQDAKGKTYLEMSRSGEPCRDPLLIENLIRSYVRFSGQNFPHILVPLMHQHGVMINPQRPLVIYESMSFDLRRLDLPRLDLKLVDSSLEVQGKRADARLHFEFESAGERIGTGFKKLVLSGLRDYQEEEIQALVTRYAGWKAAYEAA